MKKLILAGMVCMSAFLICALVQDMGIFIESQKGSD